MSKHTTDGPWVDAGLTGSNPRITGGPLRLVKCEGVVIAFLPAWLDDEHEEARANARLIVQAPVMHDLLLRLADAVEALDGTSVENEKLVDDYRAWRAQSTPQPPAPPADHP